VLLRQSLGCSCDRRHQSPGGWASLAAASHLLCCKGAHLLKYTFSIERANEQWCVTPSAEPAYRSKPPSPSMAMMTRNPVICALTEQHDASSTLRYRSASSTKFLCARPRQQNSPLAHLRPPQHLQLRPSPLPKPSTRLQRGCQFCDCFMFYSVYSFTFFHVSSHRLPSHIQSVCYFPLFSAYIRASR
jgi:hypothetical protein